MNLTLDTSSSKSIDSQADDILGRWRSEGTKAVATHYQSFRYLIDQATLYARGGNPETALAFAQAAANYAVFWHTGLYVSAELEHLICRLGKILIPSKPIER